MIEEILDEDYTNPNKEAVDKKAQYIRSRTIIYLTVMIIGGGLYGYGYLLNSGSNIQLLLGSGTFLVLALGIEFIYQLLKLLIQKKKFNQGKQYPFWFRWIEGSFVIWIFLMGFMIAGAYFRS